jgi:hypothetical protein
LGSSKKAIKLVHFTSCITSKVVTQSFFS